MRPILRLSLAVFALAVALPQPAGASALKITTDPPGAEVQLDGVTYGLAPVALTRLTPGRHELRVSAEGYLTRVDALDISDGEDLQVHAPLNPVPKPVAPAPRPAPALAQGLPAPVAPVAARPLSAPPPAQARPAAPNASSALTPLPVSQLPIAWGTQKKSLTLRVDTVPAGASVQVVGLPTVRPSPAIFTGFAPGTVTLRVFAAGFQEKRVAVDLATDSRTLVTLRPAPR